MGELSFGAEQLAGVRSSSHSKSSLKRSRRRPIPKSISNSTKSPNSPDGNKRKRVKFAGSADICELKGNLDGPSIQNEVDGAKTSEFKSFKRLLEKTAQKHYSDKIVASDLNLKNDITRHGKEASSNPVLSKSVVRRPSLLIQNVSSVAQGFLSSSPAQILEKQAEKTWTRSPRSPKVTSTARLFPPAPQIVGETDSGHSEIMGLRHEHGRTFSGKRANLLHLAAGTCSQNVDDFLLNRSDFILEILERLGLRRDSNKHGERQNPEQRTRDHQFPASSKRSDRVVEFCDTLQENMRTSEPRQCVNLLTWDDTKIQPFQCKHSSPEACFENSLWKSGLFNEKGETLLPDFDIPASAIEFRDEFDATEVEFFHTDSSAYMGKPYKNAHFNSASDRKSLHEFYITRNPTNTWNSNAEIYRIKSDDALQADCILPNTCKSERCLLEEALVPYINKSSAGLCIRFPLLERDAVELELPEHNCFAPLLERDAVEHELPEHNCFALLLEQGAVEHELPEHNCFVPEEVDHFPTFLHNIFGFQEKIGRSSSGDVYSRGLSSLQSCSFDIMFRGLTRTMKLDVGNYPSPTLPPGSSMYSDFHLSTAMQSGCENDIDFVGAPNDFPLNITILGRDKDFEFSLDGQSY